MARHRYRAEVTYEKLVIELYRDSERMKERTETFEFETMNKSRARTKARKTVSDRIGPNDKLIDIEVVRIADHVGVRSDDTSDDTSDDSDDLKVEDVLPGMPSVRGIM